MEKKIEIKKINWQKALGTFLFGLLCFSLYSLVFFSANGKFFGEIERLILMLSSMVLAATAFFSFYNSFKELFFPNKEQIKVGE